MRWTQGATSISPKLEKNNHYTTHARFVVHVGIVVVLSIIAGLIYMGRRRRIIRDARQREMNWEEAAELRRVAKDAALDAQATKVKAARSQLAAEHATVDVERLRVEAERQQQVAQARGDQSAEHLAESEAEMPFASPNELFPEFLLSPPSCRNCRKLESAEACGMGGKQNEQSLFSVGFAGKQGEYGPILLVVEIGHGSLFKESHYTRVDIRFFGD